MNLHRLAGACLTAALAFGTVASADAKTAPPKYDAVVVFGDSLSDQGNVETAFQLPPLPPYFEGRFSNALNWVDIFSFDEGVKVTNSLAHGTNYSYAFATTGPQNAPPPGLPFSPQSIAQQEQIYLNTTGGKADPKALYVIEAGATDILSILMQAESNPINLLLIPGVVSTGAQNVANETAALLNAGATHVLVSNVPDLGVLPIVLQAPGINGILAPTIANNAAQSWDYQLFYDMQPMLSRGVTLWDFYNTSAIVLKKAAQFGVTNTTQQCVNGYGVTQGVTSSCTPANVNTHAFFDQVHFTGVGYLGMTEGARCALGYTNLLGAKKSQCVMSAQSVGNGRSARFAPAQLYQQLYYRGARR